MIYMFLNVTLKWSVLITSSDSSHRGWKWNNQLTLGDDALDTHHAAQQARGQGSGGDVLRAEAALQTDVELLVLLGVGGVHRSDQVLQSPLERQQLLESIGHQSGRGEKPFGSWAYLFTYLPVSNNTSKHLKSPSVWFHWSRCVFRASTTCYTDHHLLHVSNKKTATTVTVMKCPTPVPPFLKNLNFNFFALETS